MSLPLLRNALLILPMLALAASRADAAGLYTYTDLGDINPVAINAQGMAVGYQVAGNYGDVVYSGYGPNAGQVARITSGPLILVGINARGQVLGETSSFASYVATPETGDGSPPGYTARIGPTGSPNAINDLGQVAGQTGSHASLETDGKLTDLGTLGGGFSSAFGINNYGQVVGSADRARGPAHAFLYTNGAMTDLGTLGGSASTAQAINAAGQVVGSSGITGGDAVSIITKDGHSYPGQHGFLYGGGKMTDLGTLGGGYSSADALNASGQVVGQSLTGGDPAHSEPHAFLYSDGLMRDLNGLLPAGLGWTLVSATGINDAGQIIGEARDAGGNTRGYLLTPDGMAAPAAPVPEPGPMAVFGLAAVGLAARKLRGRAA